MIWSLVVSAIVSAVRQFGPLQLLWLGLFRNGSEFGGVVTLALEVAPATGVPPPQLWGLLLLHFNV